nr:hypothetical protein [uncultured Alloprevotella sp.]
MNSNLNIHISSLLHAHRRLEDSCQTSRFRNSSYRVLMGLFRR